MLFLDFYYIEDEIYEFFYVWELRNYRVLLLIFLKLLVVVDWVFGVFFKFDLKIISKYVQRMVDFVFKNYDYDQDGYIFQEEFEKIVVSFLFFFCVMDKDREGFISRDEIIVYFM